MCKGHIKFLVERMPISEKHAKIVSNYSKNTVVAKQIGTDEIKRIPTNLFNEYKNILYVALSKDREVSIETRHKKSIASKRPRKCRKGLRSRMVASTKYIYVTPKGKFETKRDILDFYPSFTIVGISNLFSEGRVVNHKFISLHPEFKEFLGKSLNEIGFYRIKKDENN